MEEKIELTENKRPKRKRTLPPAYDDFIVNTKLSKTNNSSHFFTPSSKLVNRSSSSKPSETKKKKQSHQKLIKKLRIDNMPSHDYIPSELDKPDLISVRVINLLKSFNGRGLIADKDIPEGTCIGEYTGVQFDSKKEFEDFLQKHATADNSYAMNLGKKIIDAQSQGNFTRYINFSDSQANMMFVNGRLHNKPVVKVVASKDIQAGEQLLVDYNVYDERASKDFVFLNPEDTHLSAKEFVGQYTAIYKLGTLRIDLSPIGLPVETMLLESGIMTTILNHQLLSEHENEFSPPEVNLPAFMIDSKGHPLEFSDSDTFTPLMLAAYLGQVDNVNWLMDKGARIDRQQNHSGHCALFFALQGYQMASSIKYRNDYVAIMKNLIARHADCSVHDREDNTFLHKAIAVLRKEDFKKVIDQLKVSQPENFRNLFSYINSFEQDVVVTCISEKKFSHLDILMQAYPDYFKDSFKRTNPERTFNKTVFFGAFETLENQKDREKLQTVLPEGAEKFISIK